MVARPSGAFSGRGRAWLSGAHERDLNVITERDVRAGCGVLVVERVVDRVPCTPGACCASWAFRCAIGAGSAARAVRRGNGKEKVYGSIP